MNTHAALAATLILLAVTGQAHGHVEASASPWTSWPFAPDVLIGAALGAAFYIRGLLVRGASGRRGSWWRHAGFFAGLLAILGAVQSPLDSLALQSFAVHQIQHLLLYALGPLLIMAAAPQPILISGMPVVLQRFMLAPVMKSRAIRAGLGFLSQPTAATLIFVGSMYFWQLPSLHDLTLLDAPLHYVMHSTMLVSGLVFFWRVLDPRPSPAGAGYGTRVVMVTAAIAGTLPLGAYLAFKSPVLYASYEWFGRLGNLQPIVDEALGGLIIWVPGGIICALAILLTLRLWGEQEGRSDRWRRRGLSAGTPSSESGIMQRNRSMAGRLFAFTICAFVGLIAVITLGTGLL